MSKSQKIMKSVSKAATMGNPISKKLAYNDPIYSTLHRLFEDRRILAEKILSGAYTDKDDGNLHELFNAYNNEIIEILIY